MASSFLIIDRMYFKSILSEIHLHPCTSAYIQFVEIRFHQVIHSRCDVERQVSAENVFGGDLQEYAVDEPAVVRDEVAQSGKPLALLAAEQDAAGREQYEPIQRDGVSVMNVSDPLRSMERIAASSIVTDSTIRAADTDDGVSGEVPVDVGRVNNAVRSIDADLSR